MSKHPLFITNDIYRGSRGGDVSYWLQNVMEAQRAQGSRFHGEMEKPKSCNKWIDKSEFDQIRADCMDNRLGSIKQRAMPISRISINKPVQPVTDDNAPYTDYYSYILSINHIPTTHT